MTLPAILEQAIKNAYIEMLKDKHHSLILKKRRPIYDAISVEAGPLASKVRGWLAVLTAKKC